MRCVIRVACVAVWRSDIFRLEGMLAKDRQTDEQTILGIESQM